MFGSSFMRGISLTGAALLALGTFDAAAIAGGNNGQSPAAYDDYYTGPPMLRNIPGLRILFGDYVAPPDEPATTNSPKKKKKNKHQFDESYYEPQPASPKAKTLKPAATQSATAKPAAGNAALPQKTATTAAAASPAASGPLDCEKATAVVSGYGFSSVEASSCTGKLYAFTAKREGKNFAIKLNPASGALTEVKKLP